MIRLLQVARFFLVVPVVSGAMVAGFAAVTALGVGAIGAGVADTGRVIAPVLLLQLFATASGFRIPARRGHYDLLLTSGADRSLIVLVHWAMSAGPGLISWLTLLLVERAAGGTALTGTNTVAAMMLVSTTPWAMTVPLPRLTGAVLWLLGLAVTVTVRPDTAGIMDGLSLALSAAFGVASVLAVVMWVRHADFPLEPGQ